MRRCARPRCPLERPFSFSFSFFFCFQVSLFFLLGTPRNRHTRNCRNGDHFFKKYTITAFHFPFSFFQNFAFESKLHLFFRGIRRFWPKEITSSFSLYLAGGVSLVSHFPIMNRKRSRNPSKRPLWFSWSWPQTGSSTQRWEWNSEAVKQSTASHYSSVSFITHWRHRKKTTKNKTRPQHDGGKKLTRNQQSKQRST